LKKFRGIFFKKGKEYGRGNWLYNIFRNNKECGQKGKRVEKSQKDTFTSFHFAGLYVSGEDRLSGQYI